MNYFPVQDLSAHHQTLADFLKSDTEKIYMVIGSDEPHLYDFVNQNISGIVGDQTHWVFRYEIWSMEHSRHFLYRWLFETASGQAYCGREPWSRVIEAEPKLMQELRLLTEKDIRPLEVRFIEAIRFVASKLQPEQRLVLYFIPRASLADRVLVDFFQSLLRFLPLHTKMLIAQSEQDVLSQHADFCPSNRIRLGRVDESALARLSAQIQDGLQMEGGAGRLLRILARVTYPVELDLLARIAVQTPDQLAHLVASSEISALLEYDSRQRVRLKYPQTLKAISSRMPGDRNAEEQSIDRLALEHYQNMLQSGSHEHSAVLHHSLVLHRLEDPETLVRCVLAGWRPKYQNGAGDICELELGRTLEHIGAEHPLRGECLLALGEVREGRERFAEAIETLDPAIDQFKKAANPGGLQLALELKGRAAFAMRDTDTAKAAFDEALKVTRQLNRHDLTADLLSQLAYIHYSLRQLDEAGRLYHESIELFRLVAAHDEAQGRKGEAAQWANLGHTFYAKGDFSAAEAHHRKALDIFERLGHKQAAANQWGYLGHTFFAAQAYEKAIEAYERAAELEEQLGKPEKAAQRYASVGHSMYAQRKADLARQSFQKALDKYRELNSVDGQAAQLSNLGLVEGDQGAFDQALSYFNQASELYRQIGDAFGEIAQIIRSGHVRRAQKEFGEAIKQYREALSRYQRLGYALGEGDVELELGQLYSEKKDWLEARKCFQRAQAIFKKVSHHEKEGLCLMMLAQTEKNQGQMDAAVSAMKAALEFYKKSGNSLGVANAVSSLGLLHYGQKNYGEAERLYREALAEFKQKEDFEGQANLLSNLGTLDYQLGKLDSARENYQNALSLLRRMNHPLGMAGVLMNLCFVDEKDGHRSEAQSHLQEARKIYEQLMMWDEVKKIDQRLDELEEQSRQALSKLRSELVPGLMPAAGKKKKKQGKVGPNSSCPCGSGKKFKKCCGA